MSNFTFKKIDAPGPTGTYAYISVNGVDAAGEAVGNYGNVDGDGDGTFHGFTAQAGGSFATYDPPNSTNTDVVGITSTGEIFGDYVDNLNRQYGFVDNNGFFTQINVFLANSTTVSGVNDAGVIYGSFADFANSVHGFIDNSGTFTQIDVPGATSTSIAGVNASGVIVGTFTDAASTVHGFVDSNGSFKTIDPPGSIFTSVVGVSDSGVVVGNYQDNANNQHSFVYANGVFTTINIPGAANTGITAINAVGEIVGYYADSSGNIHGFVDEYGAITTVDVPGATETDILGVNAIGEITGYYNDSSYTQHGFVGTLPPPVTIEAAGATSLLQSGNYFFLSNSSGSELVLQAAPGTIVNESVYGSWSPIGAEQIAGGGYLVAWKEAGANLYSVWTADSTGTAISSLNYVTGSDYRLELDEALMHQDLNGDGVIGINGGTTIEADGSTSLVELNNNFFLLNSSGSELVLQAAPGDVVNENVYGPWSPIGAEQIAGGGYLVAWKEAGANLYSVWTTDSTGTAISSLNYVTGSDYRLELDEALMHQDLNGDGVIGINGGTTIEADGSTSLVELNNNFFLLNSSGSELVLQAAPGDVVNENVYGSWSPIGAEQIAGGGYLVAWKEAGANLYSVWTTDSTATAISSLNYVTGSDYRLELDEALMHQDLNGDGVIGINGGTTIEADGSTSLVELNNNFFLLNSSGSELVLQAAPGTIVNENVYGSWSPIGAEQIAGGNYLVAWKEAGANLYSVWTTDSTGTAISSLNYVTGSDYRLEAG
jgi:hypothetical protein